MITIPTVELCPHTVTGRGILRLHPEVISILAGAVYDSIEWMAFLVGTRSDDGLDITVDSLLVPLQTRNSVNCELVNREPLTEGVVGVVHSHHSMPARFSSTDDTTLNPRFPVSIVVAQAHHNVTEAEELLGFIYQAEGRAPLPCGTIGIIPFTTIPTTMPEFWPVKPIAGYTNPDDKTSLYNCPNVTRTLVGKTHRCEAKCSVVTTEKAVAIFGRNSKDFMTIVGQQTRKPKYNKHMNTYPGVPVVDNRHYFNKNKDKQTPSKWHGWYGGEVDENTLQHWSSLD